MTFRQFALKNVLRNKRIYLAYFLSSLFTVMAFFTFANFAFHPALTREDMNSNVTLGMLLAGGIIYLFSFFFVLYSMNAFLNSRKKEFGVLMIQGMSNRQIRKMVFIENMFIGFFATVLGIGIGLLFSKVIFLIAENVLVLEKSLDFYFPIKALILTFFSFILLFLLISIFITFVLRTKKIISLINENKIEKSEPKASVLLTILAFILISTGYGIAVSVKGMRVVTALIPVTIIVTIGTYFLFTQLSVFIIRRFKSRKNIFWKKTNMLLFSDLAYRMKDNARAFFMVTIISTVAFSAIGTLIGFNSYLIKGIKEVNPISFTYSGDDPDRIERIDEVIKEQNLTVKKAVIQLTHFKQKGGRTLLIVTAEEYNKYAELIGEKKLKVDHDEILIVPPSPRNLDQQHLNIKAIPLTLADGTELLPNQHRLQAAKPDVLPAIEYYFIVGDDIFKKLGEPAYLTQSYAWQVVEGEKDRMIEAGQILFEEDPLISAVDYTIYEIEKFWGPVMLVGLFIGIVFFVSAGSFLYFRLYTDLEEDKIKFKAISKIGLTKREMQKVIGGQITILFFLPIFIAIIHGAIALTALSNLFSYNLIVESSIVLASFLAIQTVYYLIVRFFYTKRITEVVF